MSSGEQKPKLDPEFVSRVFMIADAREVIINLTYSEIPRHQVTSILQEMATERGYPIQTFVEIFLRELNRKSNGEW